MNLARSRIEHILMMELMVKVFFFPFFFFFMIQRMRKEKIKASLDDSSEE